jgi:hypothetical protein
MTSECSKFEHHIPRALVGDLTAEDQQALDLHLAACTGCRAEQERYAETLRVLESAEDVPAPRHFFVYPEERTANPWQLFRQLMPRWQAASTVFAALVVLLGVFSISGFTVRADRAAWTLSFGRANESPALDVAALKAEILQVAEDRTREAALGWIQNLRSELAGSRSELTQQQQVQLVAALSTLESRLDSRIAATADDIRSSTQKSQADLYQAVSLQRSQDLNALNARMDNAAENAESRARQTDAILEMLLQVAELRIRQTGEQK